MYSILELEEHLKTLDARADAAIQSSKHHATPHKLRRDGSVVETTPLASAPSWTVSRNWSKHMFSVIVLWLLLIEYYCFTVKQLKKYQGGNFPVDLSVPSTKNY